jgi:hypothetical protein
MRFAETIKLADPELVVSRRHEEWLALSDHPVYSHEALAFAQRQLHAKDRLRQGTVSASSLGSCARAQQFIFLGMPKLQPEVQSLARMLNGSFMHLRWQMGGISAGWLHAVEVPVGTNPLRLSGTMDGIVYDGSVLELKSINRNGFGRVQTFGPLVGHLFQMATYMLCTKRTKGVFIYECKDTQEYKEIVVNRDDLPMSEAERKAVALWDSIEKKVLYEPLDKCIDRQGYIYNSCPFRDRCLQIYTWEEARVGLR